MMVVEALAVVALPVLRTTDEPEAQHPRPWLVDWSPMNANPNAAATAVHPAEVPSAPAYVSVAALYPPCDEQVVVQLAPAAPKYQQ